MLDDRLNPSNLRYKTEEEFDFCQGDFRWSEYLFKGMDASISTYDTVILEVFKMV